MKYTLYRSFGDLDRQVSKHTLIAVEYGSSIDAVTNALIQDVTDDLAESPEYAGCKTTAYAPEPVRCTRRVKRYQYEMMGKVIPPNAPKNILLDYGLTETAE